MFELALKDNEFIQFLRNADYSSYCSINRYNYEINETTSWLIRKIPKILFWNKNTLKGRNVMENIDNIIHVTNWIFIGNIFFFIKINNCKGIFDELFNNGIIRNGLRSDWKYLKKFNWANIEFTPNKESIPNI